MVEQDRQRRELDDALSVLRDLVAYWDATHPHAVDPDMDVVSRTRLVEQGADLRRRARSLVAEHPTNEETPWPTAARSTQARSSGTTTTSMPRP